MSSALAAVHPGVVRSVPGQGVTVGRKSAGRARTGLVDVALLLGVVLSIPFAIMLIGLPIVFVLQVLLRLARLV